MSDKGLQGWLKKHNDGKAPPGLSTAEKEELARYDRLWEAAAPPTSKLEVNTDDAWAKLDDRLFGDEKVIALEMQKSRRSVWNSMRILRIAAAIIVLAVAAFSIVGYLGEEPATVLAFSTTDQIQEISLPDGTRISLNKNSELSFVADAATRQLELIGEAFFDVARDEARPFTITTGELTTTVLGTSFNIRAYADETVEVSVKSGKVAVAAATEEVVLTKAEKVTYVPKAKKLTQKAAAVVEADVWKAEMLDFDGRLLQDVLPVLDRYYGKTFKVDNPILSGCLANFKVKGAAFESALETIEFTYNVKIIQQGDTILLQGGECL